MSDWLMDGARGKYGSVGRHGQPSTRSQYTDVVHLIEDYCNGEVPQWDPIKGCPCSHCGKEYNSSTTHNCRVCGLVFCSLCTGKYHLPPQFKKKKKVGPARVCFGCRDKALKFRLQCNTDFISPRRRTRVNMVQSGTRKFFIPPTEWAPPGAYPFCFGCDIELGHEFFCRLCGEMFCKDCTHKMDNVPAEYKKKGKPGAARVCLECRYHVAGGTRILPRAPTHISDELPMQEHIAPNGMALRNPDKSLQYMRDETSGLTANGIETLLGGGGGGGVSSPRVTSPTNGVNNGHRALKKSASIHRARTSTSEMNGAGRRSSRASAFKRDSSTKSINSAGDNSSYSQRSPKESYNGVLHQNPLAMGNSKTPQPHARQAPAHQRALTSIGLASKMASSVASPASPPQPQYHLEDSQQASFDSEKYSQLAGGGVHHDMVTLPSMNTRVVPQFVIPSRKQSHPKVANNDQTLTIYGQPHADAALEPVVTLSFGPPPPPATVAGSAQQQPPQISPPRLIDVHDRLVAERPEYRDVDVKYFMLNQQIYVGHWPFFTCPLHTRLSPTSIANRHNSVNSVSFMSQSSVGDSEPPQLVIHPFIPMSHDGTPTSLGAVSKSPSRRFPPPPKRKSLAGGEKSPEEQAREDEIVSAAIAKARASVLPNHGNDSPMMAATLPVAGRPDSVQARAMARGGYLDSDLPGRSASTPPAAANSSGGGGVGVHDYDPFSDTEADEAGIHPHQKREVPRKGRHLAVPNGQANDEVDTDGGRSKRVRQSGRVPYSKGTLRDPLEDTVRFKKYIDENNTPIHRTDEYSEEDTDDERPAPPVAPAPPPSHDMRKNGAIMYGRLTIVDDGVENKHDDPPADSDDDTPPPLPPADTAPRRMTMTRVRLPASAVSPATSPRAPSKTPAMVPSDQHDDPFVANFRPPPVPLAVQQMSRRVSQSGSAHGSDHSSANPQGMLAGEETDEEELSPAQARRYVKRKERKRRSRRRYNYDDGPQ